MSNPTTVRFSELELALLETLALGCSQADALREGLRLVWKQRGAAALTALGILKPEKAEHVHELIKNYPHDDIAWTRALLSVAEKSRWME